MQFDRTILMDNHIVMPENFEIALLDIINEDLEMRVGERISATLSEILLAEFDKIMNGTNPDQATEWLNINVPEYEKIVESTINEISREIWKYHRDILLYAGLRPSGDAEDEAIEELNLSIRVFNALNRAEIKTVGELNEMSDSDLLKIRNLGYRQLQEIREKVRKYIANYGKENK